MNADADTPPKPREPGWSPADSGIEEERRRCSAKKPTTN
jgi:hypothetical protein